MKINEIKHNHSLTDLLKVLLFSILMLLPFIDVGVRCGYVMFNKNAYQSYSDTNLVQSKAVVSNAEQLVDKTTYHMQYLNEGANGNTGRFGFSEISLDLYATFTNLPQHNYVAIFTYGNNSSNTILYYDDDNSGNVVAQYTSQLTQNFSFVLDMTYTSSGVLLNNWNLYTYTYSQEKLDNVFEYSVNKLESSNLYNWTTQTAIYSGVSQMTTQLGITGNIIPIILCYWFFITIIYIILDIVIKLFTILTHFIGSKTSL